MIKCNDLSDDYLSQMSQWAKANGVPLNLTFELTPFCNFSCVMCYVRLTKEQAAEQGRMMNAEQWLGIARQAKEMGALNICLTGGEPMTHPQFWEIYSQLNKMGFIISLLSNGYLIDEDAISKFRLYGAPGSIKLTLYGASDETYRRTCNSPDGFTKISKAVELIKAEGIPLKMTSTIVRENADDLQDIYKFAREHSVPMQHTISVVRSSRGSTADIEKSRFALDDFPDELTIDALEKNKFPPLKSPFAWCASKGDSLWMTWNGHLQMCSFMTQPYAEYSGNLSEDWIELLEKVEMVKSPPECADCEWSEFCQRCPGALCAESGHPEKIDAGLCDVAKRLTELYKLKLKQEEKL